MAYKGISLPGKMLLWLVFSVRLLIPMTFAFSSFSGKCNSARFGRNHFFRRFSGCLPAADVLSQAFPASPIPAFDAPMELFYEHLPLLEGLALVWVMGSICFC